MKRLLPSFSDLKTQKFFVCLMVLMCFLPCLEGVYINRFNDTLNGGISYTGNTQGLSKTAGENNQGTADSIGAFSSINTTLHVGDFPPGTTLLITENSSSAVLDLPPGSTVIYAELVISGSYGWPNTPMPPPPPPPSNVTVFITDPHSVTTPVTCDPATAQNALTPGSPASGNYVRSGIVTNQVIAGGTGTYTVSQIPGTTVASDNSHNAAGWALAVIFTNPNMNTNNINFWVGAQQGSESFIAEQVSGFCAPPSGPISARLFVSSTEGDANITGDHMLFGATPVLTSPGNALSAPNNPINNFFCSQLNTLVTMGLDPNGKFIPVGPGQLDTRGTFGDRNQNPLGATNISGGRQGFDITSIDISNKILNNQTDAFVLGNTIGDDFTINSLAIQIQVGAPIIVATKLVNGQQSINSVFGDTVTFSMSFTNNGTSDANALVFHDVLPTDMTFVSGSVLVNGGPQSSATPANITLGNLVIGGTITVEFQATVDRLPAEGCVFTNIATMDYEFFRCSTTTPTTVTVATNPVTINLMRVGPIIQAIKNVNITNATIGDFATYSISLQNLGDTISDPTIIIDIVPSGLTFVPGSVTIDGSPTLFDPTSIPVGILELSSPPTVATFQIQVTNPPPASLCTYTDIATISYSYISCNGETVTNSIVTNSISFAFRATMGQFLAVKTADPLSVGLNDIVTFTVTLTNQGPTAAASDVFFQDVLPSGLTFQPNSVIASQVVTAPPLDPNMGFNLGTMAVGQTITVQFQAQATGFPAQGCNYSNIATITYNVPCETETQSAITNEVLVPLILRGASITATKSVTPSQVPIHSPVTFTVILDNIGDRPTTSVVFRDNLPVSVDFVPNSFTYNSTPLMVSDLSAVALPNLAVNQAAVIQFQAIVNEAPDIGCTFENIAFIDYQYASCNGTFPQQTTQTTPAPFNVIRKNGSLVTTKLVNSVENLEVSLGEIVTFSFLVTNVGDTLVSQIVFSDPLQNGLTFIPGSFMINGVAQPDPNLTAGVGIDSLEPNQSEQIEFKAQVTGRIPNQSVLTNQATTRFQFIDCSGTTLDGISETNAVTLLLRLPDPKHFRGKIEKCNFLNKTEYTLIAKWKPAASPDVEFYRIYHHGKGVATVDAGDPLVFKKRLGSNRKSTGFAVTAVYKGDRESAHTKLRIQHD